MAQKKNQKDVLIVRDEKTGEISVVAGLKSDGTPKTTAATEANKGSFLQFDKNSNALDSFLDNFFRQCKEPKRFGFYRVAADTVEQVIDVFKDLLKDPEGNRDLLAPHRVDTEKYEKQTGQAQQTTEDTTPELEDSQEQTSVEEMKAEQPTQEVADSETAQTGQMPQAEDTKKEENGYKPIDESRIDWADMKEVCGIDRAALEASGDLEKMLNHGKSGLITITPFINGERFELEARLSFKESPDGTIGLVPHSIRKEPKLEQEFMGHTFTPEDKDNLKKTGNMGRVVELVDKETGEIIPSYISIDRQTNERTFLPVKDVPTMTGIGQTKFTEHEMSELRAGRAVPNKEIVLSEKRKFTATLQINVERGGVEFVPKPKQYGQNQRQRSGQTAQQPRKPQPAAPTATGQTATPPEGEQKQNVYKFQWQDKNGNIRAPKTLGGVLLTPEQQKDFTAGKAILVKDMKRDGKGEPYTAYVRYNFEEGKPKYFRNNPDVAREVTPVSESRTQVAVNTHGNTNEATRHLNQPLQQGQTQPTDGQQRQEQQRQNKPKGIGM